VAAATTSTTRREAVMGDQATLARGDRAYWEQMVSAQARYLRACDGGADADEWQELRTVVTFADATNRKLREALVARP